MAASAIECLRSIGNLESVWKAYWRSHSKSAARVDGKTSKAFNTDLEQNIRKLRRRIDGSYVYSPLRGIPIPKKDSNKKRLICVPTVEDRIVQRAVLTQIEARAAILRIENEVSYGFVKDSPKRKAGTHAARALAVKLRQAHPWALKADISAFFDNIPRDTLLEEFSRSFRLKTLEPLVRRAVACEVDDKDPLVRRVLHENGIRRGIGLRQGMPLSPILSNFVLRDFDRAFVKNQIRMVRYADDFVIFCESQLECERILRFSAERLKELGLQLSEQKTTICNPREAVEFLGMDLAPFKNTNRYHLFISTSRMQAIRKAFTRYHDWTVAYKEGVNVARLTQKLDSMKDGYLTAYDSAHNIGDLEILLNQLAGNCVDKIYRSLFGVGAITHLTTEQRSFLGLSRI